MSIDLTKVYKRYKGSWVALNETWGLVSHDKDIRKAQKKAIDSGYKNPIMFKVPKKNIAYFGNSM